MPEPALKIASDIIHRLRARGHEALLAGGCVRDHLLKREPQDYDIATSARPMNVISTFERTEAVGAAFGVILVIEQGQPFEVAAFRSDGIYSDGRHPDTIAFTSAQQDAQRRDFTVNALFMNPDDKQIIDYVGGQQDLKDKCLRAVGDPALRFEEDKLRVLRCVRFAAELNFKIEEKTWEAVKQFAPKIKEVAWERILQELNKMFSGSHPAVGLELLKDSGLMDELLPELRPMIGSTQTPRFHPEGDVWVHTKRVLEYVRSNDTPLRWAALLHDIGKPATWSQDDDGRIRNNAHESVGAEMAAKICLRLKMSKESSERIVTLVADHLRFNHIREMKESKLKRLMRRDDIEQLFELHRADCQGSHGGMDLYDFAREKQAYFVSLEKTEPLRPIALVSGHDLIDLGMNPGPVFKNILADLEDEQLEGRLKNREEALAWIKKHPDVHINETP